MKYSKKYLFILLVFSLTHIFSSDKSILKKDAQSIINIIRMSSEPDLYSEEIKKGINNYRIKLSYYSNEDVVYISKICKSFIDLELSVYDGFIDFYNDNKSTLDFEPKKDKKVQHHLNELRSYGINLQMEQELYKTKLFVDQTRKSMPPSQFKELLYTIRRMIWSDYFGVYNAIFK